MCALKILEDVNLVTMYKILIRDLILNMDWTDSKEEQNFWWSWWKIIWKKLSSNKINLLWIKKAGFEDEQSIDFNDDCKKI